MTRSMKDLIVDRIQKNGGWVNTHAHFDRAYTISQENLEQSHRRMENKWTLVDVMKRASSEEAYAERIERALCVMIAQGVRYCATFIDVDPVCELRAIKAAVAIKKKYANVCTLVLINQVLKGVINKEARRWAEKALEYVDIIGGLPSKDRPHDLRHLDIIFEWAKQTRKVVHVHVDQENNPHEHDIERLARRVIKRGLEGKVAAIHGISIAAQSTKRRKQIYRLIKAAGLSLICCPSAALSMRQLPYKTALHNSIAPVPELVSEGIPVAIGVDNIADIYQPLIDGNMYAELRILAESCRFYDLDSLAQIGSSNGLYVLGLRRKEVYVKNTDVL
ncbi:amidohydrolase family protein [Candidatus Gottesmanbacteria bacterium]|nr:amidohydrolase family protein [Candidatus Gottesmanbacteria bacterium]